MSWSRRHAPGVRAVLVAICAGLLVAVATPALARPGVPARPAAAGSFAPILPRQFGTYAAGPHNSAWLPAMNARYGDVTLAIPAWGANQIKAAPSLSVVELAAQEGIYAALSVCAYPNDWIPAGQSYWDWDQTMGTSCVQTVANTMNNSPANVKICPPPSCYATDYVQAVVDGSQIDSYATPAQQVYMYQLMKEYFPNAEVDSYHAGELIAQQSAGPIPGQSDGGYGAAGRSNDVVLLGDAQGYDTYTNWINGAQVVTSMIPTTGSVRYVLMRNTFRMGSDDTVVKQDLSVLDQVDATAGAAGYPGFVWGYEIRQLSQLNSPQDNTLAAELTTDVKAWLAEPPGT